MSQPTILPDAEKIALALAYVLQDKAEDDPIPSIQDDAKTIMPYFLDIIRAFCDEVERRQTNLFKNQINQSAVETIKQLRRELGI